MAKGINVKLSWKLKTSPLGRSGADCLAPRLGLKLYKHVELFSEVKGGSTH